MKAVTRSHQIAGIINLVVACCALSCSTLKNSQPHSGAVLTTYEYFDSVTHRYEKFPMYHDRKLVFRDSVVIQPSIKTEITEINGKDVYRVFVQHYIYHNLKSKAVYEYSSFSDTARLLRKYTSQDTVVLTGGWGFYMRGPVLFPNGFTYAGDTVIENIVHKRIIHETVQAAEGKRYTYINMGYLRCDKKGSIFHLDKTFDESHECPLVRFEYIIHPIQTWIKSEIRFISDSLTRQERKVFDKWARFEMENPI